MSMAPVTRWTASLGVGLGAGTVETSAGNGRREEKKGWERLGSGSGKEIDQRLEVLRESEGWWWWKGKRADGQGYFLFVFQIIGLKAKTCACLNRQWPRVDDLLVPTDVSSGQFVDT